MKGLITTNFRGLRALVIHRADANRDMLVSVLGRLGLAVTEVEPDDLPPGGLLASDLVLFDADEDTEAPWSDQCGGKVPLIALIGNEAPSRLARVVRNRCDSHILKPIRTTGVFTAVLLAVNGRERQRQTERQVETMRQRLAGRRVVMKAVIHLMSVDGSDENTVYARLRQEAMKRRVPIDELAKEILGLEIGSDRKRRWSGQSRNP